MTSSQPQSPPLDANLSLDAARRQVAALLAEASGYEAALDARILLEAATGLDRTALFREGAQPLGPVAAAHLHDFLTRRRAGEPVWRILGQREFWGLTFATTPAVLDPRPDTETLVAAALEAMASRKAEALNVLDLGVGSGAILGAILNELPNARGWGVDRSEAACRVARRNLEALGLGDRTMILNGHWGDALATGCFDLVVSNPPYIESAVIPTLASEVRDFDPTMALDGGLDGLDCYRAVAADLPRLLAPQGIVAFEVGMGQAAAVTTILSAADCLMTTTRRDLRGHERAVVASLKASRSKSSP